MVTEMIKDEDIPYLSIVGHVLAVVSGNQEEHFWGGSFRCLSCVSAVRVMSLAFMIIPALGG